MRDGAPAKTSGHSRYARNRTKMYETSRFETDRAGEAGNALPEYAIVIAALSIIAIASFNLFGHVSTNVVTTNQNNFQNSATMSYQH